MRFKFFCIEVYWYYFVSGVSGIWFCVVIMVFVLECVCVCKDVVLLNAGLDSCKSANFMKFEAFVVSVLDNYLFFWLFFMIWLFLFILYGFVFFVFKSLSYFGENMLNFLNSKMWSGINVKIKMGNVKVIGEFWIFYSILIYVICMYVNVCMWLSGMCLMYDVGGCKCGFMNVMVICF